MEILLTTTGNTAVINLTEFGSRIISHPTTNLNLLDEFTIEEIRDSLSLQDALDNNEIVLTNQYGRNIIDLRFLDDSQGILEVLDSGGLDELSALTNSDPEDELLILDNIASEHKRISLENLSLNIDQIGSGTNGSVLFISSNIISENNSNFYWDNTEIRLGIGTDDPNAKIHLKNSASNQISIITEDSSGDIVFEVNNDEVISEVGYWIKGVKAFDLEPGSNGGLSIGEDALKIDTVTGVNNTTVGYRAGRLLTSGQQNTILGWSSGLNLTEGEFNTLIGWNAGSALTTHSNNVAIGRFALGNNTSSGNVAIGRNALHASSTNGFNVAIGFEAASNTTGSFNIAIGRQSGFQISGSTNISLGFQAALQAHSHSSTIAIGRQADPNKSNQALLGGTLQQINEFVIGRGPTRTNTASVVSTTIITTSAEGTDLSANSNLIFAGSQGTGTGNGGNLIFQIAPPGSAGSTPNTLSNSIIIHGNGDGVEFIDRTYHDEIVENTGTTYTADLSKGNIFKLTANNNFTFDYTNAKTGTYIFIIRQDSTGNRTISFASSKFRTASGNTPILTTTAGSVDIFSCIYSEEEGRMFIYDTNDFQDI